MDVADVIRHACVAVFCRAVPVGIALLCISNPQLSVLDTLSKLSHDPDMETACNAILAMGLVGAGKRALLPGHAHPRCIRV